MALSARWMHPIQQQGRRMPSMSSSTVRRTWSFLVSAVLTDIVQHIHSLRASGVISSQAASALGDAASACRKSVGSLCATPPDICALVIRSYYAKLHLRIKQHRHRRNVSPYVRAAGGSAVVI